MKRAFPTTILSLMTAFSAASHAAPDGYSINSDSPSSNSDSLYRIDLATGVHTRLGRVQAGGQTKIDVEGLAFAANGTLYGVDDDSMTLFPIDVANGSVFSQQQVSIKGMPSGGGNDFGLTFACDGKLYATSVATQTLYWLDPAGVATPIGAVGSLKANISALAAFGNPVKLYGLGNGLKGDGSVDSRTLYEIDPQTGQASARPQQLGAAAASYDQAGLAFDSAGVLWAITDRRAVAGGPFPSQILRIDTTTGVATFSAETSEMGFESLAISIPDGCAPGEDPTPESVQLTVNKEWHFNDEELNFINTADIELKCENILDGDGERHGNDMEWRWDIEGNSSQTATVYPDGEGNTFCYAIERQQLSAVEAANGCGWQIPINYGDPDKSCTILNTVFLEGVPTLDSRGMALLALLMLAGGVLALRRS
jgi:hypothetical protein